MATLRLVREKLSALSRSREGIERFDEADLANVANDVKELLKKISSETDIKNSCKRLRDFEASLSSASSHHTLVDIKKLGVEDSNTLLDSIELARQGLTQCQSLLARLSEIETKIGNDIRIEHDSREKLHSQKIRHTKREKRVDVSYSVLQRVASTASVIAVIILLLWIAKLWQLPIPGLLAPVPADKHFKTVDPSSSVNAPHTQIDLFLNKLWKPTTIMRAPDQGAH